MKKGFDFLLDLDDFSILYQLPNSQNNYTILYAAQKKISPSPYFILKTFNFECVTSKDQKILMQTFSQICSQKNQYLRCYNRFSFAYQEKYTPTFSMKFISSNTLADRLQDPQFYLTWTKHDMINCLFAVAEGLLYLHEHLIYHGNLCPSNILIDKANQCYVCDFGLYPIKKLYINPENLANNDYKDPYMGNKEPNFKNDIYSYGVLLCQLCIVFYMPGVKISVRDFIMIQDQNKFKQFPEIFTKIIKSCLSSYPDRPSFKQIIKMFQESEFKNLYDVFSKNNYIVKLAQLGDPISLNKLGEMFEDGKGIEKNHLKALSCYEKASLQNNSEAQSNYGVLLIDKGNEADMIKGANYLRLSAEQGNIHGMANYGMALKLGEGVKKNIEKSLEYLKKSADLGYAYAQLYYGLTLMDKKNLSDLKKKEGLKYIKMAMDQEYPDAFYEYGKMLKNPKNSEKDLKLACDYFKRAADLGNDQAMIEYANANLNGIGIPAKRDIALRYYKMASEKGNEEAKNMLALTLGTNKSKKSKSSSGEKSSTRSKNNSSSKKQDSSNSLSSLSSSDETQSDDFSFNQKNSSSPKKKATEKDFSPSQPNQQAADKALSTSISPSQNKNLSLLDDSNFSLYLSKIIPAPPLDPNALSDDQKLPQNLSNTVLTTEIRPSPTHSQESASPEPPIQRHTNGMILTPISSQESSMKEVEILSDIPPFDSDTSSEKLVEIFKQIKNDFTAISKVSNSKAQIQTLLRHPLYKYENAFIQTNNRIIIYQYGKLYEKGQFIDKNKAFKYYKMSADLEYAKAQANYGVALQNGKDIPKNLKLGFYYLEKSAKQKDLNGLVNCGLALYNGEGVKKNEELGLKYIKESADNGNIFAQLNFGLLTNDDVLGHQYIEQLYNIGYGKATFHYAKDFMEGRGVEKNLHKAAELLQNLYDFENKTKALINLINCLDVIDKPKAVQYRKLLADTKDKKYIKFITNAQYEYGIELIKGDYIPKNVTEGCEYIKKSNQMSDLRKKYPEIYAQIPHDFSSVKRKVDIFLRRNKQIIDQHEYEIIESAYNGNIDDTLLAAKMFETDNEYQLANFFYEIAADSNQREAAYILGKYYIEGKNKLKTNVTKGRKYLQQAADLGDQNAKFEIIKMQIKQINKKSRHAKMNELLPKITELASEKYIEAIILKAKLLIANKSYLEAETELISALSLEPNDHHIIYKIGKLMISIPGKYEEGFKLYERCGENEPKAAYFLGKYYAEKENKSQEDLLKAEYYLAFSAEFKIKDSQRILSRCKKEISQNKKLLSLNSTPEPVQQQTSTISDPTHQQVNYNSIPQPQEVNAQIGQQVSVEQKGQDQGNESNEVINEDQFIDASLPTEELIRKGDEYYKNDSKIDAIQCYSIAATRGDPVGYYKYAKFCEDFGQKLEYYQNAIMNKIEGAFKEWRKCIFSHVSRYHSRDSILTYAQRFEEYSDYSDAAILYKKANENGKYKECYERAKQNYQYIQDGEQQLDFGNLLESNGETDLAVIMFKKASDNGIHQAEKKTREISQNKMKQIKGLSQIDSLLEQGICYLEGKNGTAINVNKAFNYFTEASEKGCPKADYYIGVYYKKGYGADKMTNNMNCVQYFKKSADAGDSDGQNGYADCLKDGIGVDQNLELAIHYYKLSADQGNLNGEFNYGRELYTRSTNDQEKNYAIYYLKKAAERQLPDAMYFYSKVIADTNHVESEKYLNLAIDNKSELAIDDYGDYLEEQGNTDKASELYKNAARNGMKIGYRKYAKLNQDDDEIQEYLKKAAQFGDPEDQFNYAYFLFCEGEDTDERALYFKKSAEQGYVKAFFYYAQCLEHGERIKKDLKLAAQYYTLSYLNDSKSPAKFIYDRLKEQNLINC